MKSIFDLVTAQEIAIYWTELASNREPYLGEELFQSQQKLGLRLDWIKGSKGLPVVLLPSAYDVATKKRDRIGMQKTSTNMPFFKEGTYIDEELRQELNMVIESGRTQIINTIMSNIFADEAELLEGARAQRERIRMMALTTGAVSIEANGQSYDYDYGMPQANKAEVKVSWSNQNATVIDDIRDMQTGIYERTGVKPTRAVISPKTFGYLRKNNEIRQGIRGTDSTAPVSDSQVLQYIKDMLGMTIAVYSKMYRDENKQAKAYMPDDLFVMFPEGKLGTGWFGTTPEQSDLMNSNVANVAIVDTGVAITTSKRVDPVNVETKVSMIYLPSFEAIDYVGHLDLNPNE